MNLHKHLLISLSIFLIVISLGAYAYYKVEGWSLLDSFYFVVITITTIGYGDFVPQTVTGKVFTMFFSFFGIAMAFYFLSILSSNLFKKHLGQKVGQIKKEVQREEEVKEETEKIIKSVIKPKSKKK